MGLRKHACDAEALLVLTFHLSIEVLAPPLASPPKQQQQQQAQIEEAAASSSTAAPQFDEHLISACNTAA